MSLPNLWSRLRRPRASARRQLTLRKPARPGRAFVPQLEGLEERTALSTLTVTNPADSGDGSLRAVIAMAQSGDQIVFDTGLKGQAITLTGGPLVITQSIDIEGPGADQLAVSGNHASRVVTVSGGVTVILAGLTIRDGLVGGSDAGGGILNMGSTLTLANDVLTNNQVISDPGVTAQGGAVDNVAGATLLVSNSLFSQHQAKGSSGGAANGGTIVNSASRLTVSQSTFSGNQALGGDGGGNALGGAILNNQAGVVTISDSTFSSNLAMGAMGVLSAAPLLRSAPLRAGPSLMTLFSPSSTAHSAATSRWRVTAAMAAAAPLPSLSTLGWAAPSKMALGEAFLWTAARLRITRPLPAPMPRPIATTSPTSASAPAGPSGVWGRPRSRTVRSSRTRAVAATATWAAVAAPAASRSAVPLPIPAFPVCRTT